MSVCSSTFRALSRSRNSTSKTLLPFLYQTTTIQQWKPATRQVARRNISSRRNNGDHVPFESNNYIDDIPFEDDNLPPAIDQEPPRKTTITGSERAAFQKLYKTFKTQGRPKNDEERLEELDQIADEYYEDDKDDSSQSLEKVFDEVLKGAPRLRDSRTITQRPKPKSKETAKPLSDKAQKRKDTKIEAAKAEATRLRELKFVERNRVDLLLQDARTDRELWQILDREVFEQVRQMDLDGTKTTDKPGSKGKSKKSDATAPDHRILFQNYPHHLITAVSTLRTEFPSSPLPLSILPTIKSLGRASYALGATTTLYKHLIRTAWIQQSSYTYINTLLVDMNNGAIEFDHEVLALLDSIIKEHEMARSSVLGKEMQMVYSMEQFLEGIRKIREWRNWVAQRLGVSTRPVVERGPAKEQGRRFEYESKRVDGRSTRGSKWHSGAQDISAPSKMQGRNTHGSVADASAELATMSMAEGKAEAVKD